MRSTDQTNNSLEELRNACVHLDNKTMSIQIERETKSNKYKYTLLRSEFNIRNNGATGFILENQSRDILVIFKTNLFKFNGTILSRVPLLINIWLNDKVVSFIPNNLVIEGNRLKILI